MNTQEATATCPKCGAVAKAYGPTMRYAHEALLTLMQLHICAAVKSAKETALTQ